MIEGLPGVPPALMLLVKELRGCSSWPHARRRIKGMLPDLRQQSEAFAKYSIEHRGYSKDPSRFEVHLHGALDLLSGDGCINPDCRLKAADRISRSIGLIADRVWLTDRLSDRFVDFGRATNAKLDEVIADTLVLVRLLPLIDAGVIRFRSPWLPACPACVAEFDRQLASGTARLLERFRREFKIQRRTKGEFVAYTGKCFEPPLFFQGFAKCNKAIPTASDYAQQSVAHALRTTLWAAREASLSGGAVLSNSRVGLAGLLEQEGRLLDRKTLLLMDREREFSVPWVSELTAAQIAQLRHEASRALPAFREKVAKALSASASDGAPSVSSLISELREQSAEVRAELDAKRANSARYWKVTYGLLGLGLSAYGVATDQILPGVGGLLPVIHLLVNHRTGYEAEVAKLTSRPGYVLVKAQDILAHAH